MQCPSCRGSRMRGVIRHQPGCPFLLSRATVNARLTEHPDLVEWNVESDSWYPAEAWPPGPRRSTA